MVADAWSCSWHPDPHDFLPRLEEHRGGPWGWGGLREAESWELPGAQNHQGNGEGAFSPGWAQRNALQVIQGALSGPFHT